MWSRRGAHAAGVLGHQRRQRAVRGHDHVPGAHAAARPPATGPRPAPRTGTCTARALEDPRAGRLGGAGERAVPARRVERAVVLGEARHEPAAAERRRQVLVLDQLGREAVLGAAPRA